MEKKVRPVIILSKLTHNKIKSARILIAPLTTAVPNTALLQYPIEQKDTLYGQGIERQSNILFDFSAMVPSHQLKPTHDGINESKLKDLLSWWKWCVETILPAE